MPHWLAPHINRLMLNHSSPRPSSPNKRSREVIPPAASGALGFVRMSCGRPCEVHKISRPHRPTPPPPQECIKHMALRLIYRIIRICQTGGGGGGVGLCGPGSMLPSPTVGFAQDKARNRKAPGERGGLGGPATRETFVLWYSVVCVLCVICVVLVGFVFLSFRILRTVVSTRMMIN